MARTKIIPIDPSICDRLNAIGAQMDSVFVERGGHITALLVTTLSAEHLLFIGDPGTGKTAMCKAFAKHITGARYWKRTLGSFTPPEKIVGPMDIKEFQQGNYVNQINGSLPTADLACLDELFKGSQVVNEMLEILGEERAFDDKPIPLISSSAATNWPEILRKDDIVDALYDRFLTRVVVEEITTRVGRIEVMKAAVKVKAYKPSVTITIDELRAAVADVETVEVGDPIYEIMADLMASLDPTRDSEGVQVSPRRMGQLIKLLKATAWLQGRAEVTLEDFGVLAWGMWQNRDDIEMVEAAISKIDSVQTKEITDLLDKGRKAYAECQRAGFSSGRVKATLETMRDLGRQVKVMYAKPVFTSSSRDTIERSMVMLKIDFTDLLAKAKELT